MTSRSFRRLFPQLNVQSIPEDEFYRQASLSQLLTGPDEQDLASFRPDIKDPLELIEATPELAGMLGSSLEFVDSRYLESSPPLTPPPPPSLDLPPEQQQDPTKAISKTDSESQSRTVKSGQIQGLNNGEISAATAKTETKMTSAVCEVQQACKNPVGATNVKSNVTINVNLWEQSKNTRIANCASKVDSNMWLQRQNRVTLEDINSVLLDPRRVTGLEPQRKTHSDSSTLEQSSSNTGIANSANPESKIDARTWQQQQLGNYSARNSPAVPDVKVIQRLRSRTAGNSDNNVPLEQQQMLKDCDSASLNGTTGSATLIRQNPPKTLDSTKSLVNGRLWELQRQRNKNTVITDPAKSSATVDVRKWEQQGIKQIGGNSPATKREASFCDLGQGAKTIKVDPAWQRSLGNVRVHIRDLGMKVVGGTTIQRDLKKEQGKVSGKAVRAKARS